MAPALSLDVDDDLLAFGTVTIILNKHHCVKLNRTRVLIYNITRGRVKYNIPISKRKLLSRTLRLIFSSLRRLPYAPITTKRTDDAYRFARVLVESAGSGAFVFSQSLLSPSFAWQNGLVWSTNETKRARHFLFYYKTYEYSRTFFVERAKCGFRQTLQRRVSENGDSKQ